MLNRITMQGRMVTDPERKTTMTGVPVVTFRVACERDFKGQDGKRQTDFLPVVAWRNNAEWVAQWGRKGRMIDIDGRLQIRSYTDRDGNKRQVAEIQADHIYFLDRQEPQTQGYIGSQSYTDGKGGYGYTGGAGGGYDADEEFPEVDDDSGLPF